LAGRGVLRLVGGRDHKNKTAANHFGAVSDSTFTINYVLYNYVEYFLFLFYLIIL